LKKTRLVWYQTNQSLQKGKVYKLKCSRKERKKGWMPEKVSRIIWLSKFRLNDVGQLADSLSFLLPPPTFVASAPRPAPIDPAFHLAPPVDWHLLCSSSLSENRQSLPWRTKPKRHQGIIPTRNACNWHRSCHLILSPFYVLPLPLQKVSNPVATQLTNRAVWMTIPGIGYEYAMGTAEPESRRVEVSWLSPALELEGFRHTTNRPGH
jgi:hypothetical protein